MRRMPVLFLATVLAAIGCASSGPPLPPAQVAETEAAIRSAENAGAAAAAPELLNMAHRSFDAGKAEVSRGNPDAARRDLEEARACAAAAEARANAERLKRQAAELKGQADELESKAKQLQERARP
ncbi:MAG TPA: DUF4398 domain-containing protein [Thermoanaerobaculia bacterium]|nr:DUF4398 domain-containing protein [Thermoanaerobaculia bacterium]